MLSENDNSKSVLLSMKHTNKYLYSPHAQCTSWQN